MPTPPPKAPSLVRRLSLAGSNIGLSVLGAGLLALAAVEAGLLVNPESRAEAAPPAPPLGMHAALAGLAVPDARAALEASSASAQDAVPERRGNIVSITANSHPQGVALYRAWGSGRIEVSMLGQNNVWSEWAPVAPGLKGTAPNAGSGNGN